MELFLFEPSRLEQLYNCSRISVDQVPLSTRQSILNGTVILLLFFVIQPLYTLCMLSIAKNLEHSCYKILFYIGLVDICALFFQGLQSGVYCFTGGVYCSAPEFNYLSGCVRTAMFAAETSADLVLALNRLVEAASPKLGEILYSGRRTWVWLGFCSLFGLYYFMYLPSFFNAIFIDWLVNPYQGYPITVDTSPYLKSVSFYYNLLLTFGFPVIYAAFIVCFQLRIKKMSVANSQSIAFQKIVFVQAVSISGANVGSTLIHAVTGRLPVSNQLILLGFYCNYFMFGFPPFIYLTVNKTIRRDCAQMVGTRLTTLGQHLYKSPVVHVTGMPSSFHTQAPNRVTTLRMAAVES